MTTQDIKIGAWYLDTEFNYKYRVLAVHQRTLEVIDEHGYRRLLNKDLWQDDMSRGILVIHNTH